MKNIKIVLIAAAICALMASCGMNNTAKNGATPAPTMSGNVSNTDNGTVEDKNDNQSVVGDAANGVGNAAKGVADTAGNVVRDAGDAVGDAANGVGNAAKDAANGAADAVGGNDANGNGK